MKILMAHNYYQQYGGEDVSFEAEAGLLETNGHQVIRYARNNTEIKQYGLFQKFRLPINTIWSSKSHHDVEKIIQKENPDLVHFQNTFPLISPSAFYACKHKNIPIIWTIRNYRLMCLNGLFLRDNRICEVCKGKSFAYPGIRHACYRNSHLQSTVVAAMLTYHKLLKTWSRLIDKYICLSEFSRDKLIEGGLSGKKIFVKPNFINDPGENKEERKYALFIGRLSEEKGIHTILKSIERNPSIPLVIVGSGPLEREVKEVCGRLRNVSYLGQIENNQIFEVLKKAKFLIFPTLVFETFGRVIVEAFACSTPVIASRIGAVKELVKNGKTGILFNPEDSENLTSKMKWMWDHPLECRQMGDEARQEYINRFTPEFNYQALISIYNSVLERN
jgi:glycosyltransferase involved in cell wall biosynthesis